MTDKNKLGEEEMNRRTVIALVSAVGIATAWTKPVINSVITPAHAQTSCSNPADIDVLGAWNFTDQDNQTVRIEFIDSDNLNFDNRAVNDPWAIASDGTLIIDIFNPAAAWQGTATQESNCVASEITITIAPTIGNLYSPPLVGVRI